MAAKIVPAGVSDLVLARLSGRTMAERSPYRKASGQRAPRAAASAASGPAPDSLWKMKGSERQVHICAPSSAATAFSDWRPM